MRRAMTLLFAAIPLVIAVLLLVQIAASHFPSRQARADDVPRGPRATLVMSMAPPGSAGNPGWRSGDGLWVDVPLARRGSSYLRVDQALAAGRMPPVEAVRTEELVNGFRYADPPGGGAAFAVHAEVGPAPWNPRHRLVRLVIHSGTLSRDAAATLAFDAVQAYRLIGFEGPPGRHGLAPIEVTPSELLPGETVTALFEIVPRPGQRRLFTLYAHGEDVAVTRAVDDPFVALADTSDDFRFAAAVAGFGMLLRRSPHRGDLDWKDVRALAAGALGTDADHARQRFVTVVDRAAEVAALP